MWHASTDSVYEDVEPKCILDARLNDNGERDFLVEWADSREDEWVGQTLIKTRTPVPHA